MAGLFVTFEGPDGCGKTTQITLLAETLRQQGYRVCHTREPGGTDIGKQIRQVLHDRANDEMVPTAELLLYAADRAQHVEQIMRPALQRQEIVLSDRYFDSTLAYQGYGHGLDLVVLRKVTEIAISGLVPDLTFYLDIDPETGLRRRQQDSNAEWNRLDAFALDFHERVRAGYAELIAEDQTKRWVQIDANGSPEAVQGELLKAITQRLKTADVPRRK